MRPSVLFAIAVTLLLVAGCVTAPDEGKAQGTAEGLVKTRLVRLQLSYVELPTERLFGRLGESLSTNTIVHRVDRGWAEEIIEEARQSGELVSGPPLLVSNHQPCTIDLFDKVPCVTDFTPIDGEWTEVTTKLDEGVRLELTPTLQDERWIDLDTSVTVTSLRRPIATLTTNIKARDGAPEKILTIELPEQDVRRSSHPLRLEDADMFLVATQASQTDGKDASLEARALLILVKADITEMDLPGTSTEDRAVVSVR